MDRFPFYCHALSGELVDNMLFTIAFQRNSSAALFLFTAHGIWNMYFFRQVIPPFCVSQKLSTLGAITCSYISAVCTVHLFYISLLLLPLLPRACVAIAKTLQCIKLLYLLVKKVCSSKIFFFLQCYDFEMNRYTFYCYETIMYFNA